MMFFVFKQKLSWFDFCQSALPAEKTELTVIDYLGYTGKLIMDLCHSALQFP